MYKTPWGEFVAVDSRAQHIPLVQAHGWTIYADGSVSRINGDTVAEGNPLTPIQ